jgi:hypothetical protein
MLSFDNRFRCRLRHARAAPLRKSTIFMHYQRFSPTVSDARYLCAANQPSFILFSRMDIAATATD